MNLTHRQVPLEWKYIAFLVLFSAIIALGGVASAQQSTTDQVPTLGVLDHFKCYQAEGKPVNDLAFLRDQFGVADKTYERDIVTLPKLFCNPVGKIHETAGAVNNVGISNPDNHLVWYDIKPALNEQFKTRQVVVTNQFAPNGQKLTVIRPEFLAVPTQKVSVDGKPTEQGLPKGLDHFKCYRVEGAAFVAQTAQLWDQFNPANTWDTFKVLRAQYLCNPTLKAHFTGFNDETGAAQFTTATIQHPADHLVCYALQPSTLAPHQLVVNNQFGSPQQLSTIQTKLLCVPSTKRVIDPNPNQNPNTN